jgi:hypothetical protein
VQVWLAQACLHAPAACPPSKEVPRGSAQCRCCAGSHGMLAAALVMGCQEAQLEGAPVRAMYGVCCFVGLCVQVLAVLSGMRPQ